MVAAEEPADREEPRRSRGPVYKNLTLVVLGAALLVTVVAALYLWDQNRTLSSRVESALSDSAAAAGDRLTEAELLLDDALRGFMPENALASAIKEVRESAGLLRRIATVPLDPDNGEAWLLMNRALLASDNLLNEAHWKATQGNVLGESDRGALIELRALVGAINDAVTRTARYDGGTVVFDPSFVEAASLVAEDYIGRY